MKMLRFIFPVFLLVLSSTVSCFGETWNVASLEWQPYSGKSLENNGESFIKLRKILATNPEGATKVVAQFYPWKRIPIEMDNTANALVGYFPCWSSEVKAGYFPSLPIDTSNISVISMKDKDIKFSSIEELFSKYKVGVVAEYGYPDDILKYMNDNKNVIKVISDELLSRMLVADRFDVALTDSRVLMYYNTKEKKPPVKIDKVLFTMPLVMALKNKTDADKLNELIKKYNELN